jgi:HmuY protein
MRRLQKIFLGSIAVLSFLSCKKDVDPVIALNKSTGAIVQLNGIVGTEAGSAAGNAVYVDFSTNKTSTARRASWDIGLSSGADYRIILNYTAGTGAKVLPKFDLANVTAADTIGLSLSTSQTMPEPIHFSYFDNISGDLNLTLVPPALATDALNPVIIINRGTAGGIAPRPWIKMRLFRNGNGYKVQYAGIQENTFTTVFINKNDLYNFQFLSFTNGQVSVEPEKLKWDIVWSYSQYQANFGAGFVPYNFSDIISINYLAGVQVKEKIYGDAVKAGEAFAAFNIDSVNATTLVYNRWGIANTWRSTQPATGARLDRFYVIKDANGNYYKLKCLAMGVGADGGTRGKPEFKYDLIK